MGIPDLALRGAAVPTGLVYVTDGTPGIRRCRHGRSFRYQLPDGRWLSPQRPADRAVLARIRGLAVPPAYRDVWICVQENGHLQATGRDARGRKQYRYHPDWRGAREFDKFHRMVAFGMALSRLRRCLRKDLRGDTSRPTDAPPGREAVLAALVRLLDVTLVRVGNEEYLRSNRSYGLTTLRNRHAAVRGNTLKLSFRGKSGVPHQLSVQDPRVARIVRRCQAMPGQELFQFEDEDGQPHGVDSGDVNAYIREASGGEFTAKDFRTWHASVLAWTLLAPAGAASCSCAISADALASSAAKRQRRVADALAKVAARLGNTAAVCRKSYVHPQVLACALSAEWPHARPAAGRACGGLNAEERGFLGFLRYMDAAQPARRTAKRVVR